MRGVAARSMPTALLYLALIAVHAGEVHAGEDDDAAALTLTGASAPPQAQPPFSPRRLTPKRSHGPAAPPMPSGCRWRAATTLGSRHSGASSSRIGSTSTGPAHGLARSR